MKITVKSYITRDNVFMENTAYLYKWTKPLTEICDLQSTSKSTTQCRKYCTVWEDDLCHIIQHRVPEQKYAADVWTELQKPSYPVLAKL